MFCEVWWAIGPQGLEDTSHAASSLGRLLGELPGLSYLCLQQIWVLRWGWWGWSTSMTYSGRKCGSSHCSRLAVWQVVSWTLLLGISSTSNFPSGNWVNHGFWFGSKWYGDESNSDWLYSLQWKMKELYTVSKNKTGGWLWLRSWTPFCQIQT